MLRAREVMQRARASKASADALLLSAVSAAVEHARAASAAPTEAPHVHGPAAGAAEAREVSVVAAPVRPLSVRHDALPPPLPCSRRPATVCALGRTGTVPTATTSLGSRAAAGTARQIAMSDAHGPIRACASPRHSPESVIASVITEGSLLPTEEPARAEETTEGDRSAVALQPGRYRIKGVNIDVTQNHSYDSVGLCTLYEDGSLSGELLESSRVWRGSTCRYRLTHGQWTAAGHLFFHLEHADRRADVFDPFVFSVSLCPALPDSIAAACRVEGAFAPAETGGGGGSGSKWMATAGWWKTYDGTAAAPPVHSYKPDESRESLHGSFGRLKYWHLVRSD